jgi:hypothetical protein
VRTPLDDNRTNPSQSHKTIKGSCICGHLRHLRMSDRIIGQSEFYPQMAADGLGR